MITKYIPAELLKKIIIDWWRETILTNIGSEKDDHSLLLELVKNIKETHARLSKQAMDKYEALPDSIKKNKNRSEIIRENIYDWFGATNIIIFNRFIKTPGG